MAQVTELVDFGSCRANFAAKAFYSLTSTMSEETKRHINSLSITGLQVDIDDDKITIEIITD
jgi:hypothetical protein